MPESPARTAPATSNEGVIRFVSDTWPLLALGVIAALLIRACVPAHSSAPAAAAAPSFDTSGAPKVANAQAMAALSALTPASGIAQVMDALGLLVIDFGVGSSSLPETADPALAQVAAVIAARPPSERFEISAYADGTGSPLADLELSRRRAQAVVDSLVNQGVPTQRLQARGVSDEDSVVSEPGQQSRARPQRIRFTLLP